MLRSVFISTVLTTGALAFSAQSEAESDAKPTFDTKKARDLIKAYEGQAVGTLDKMMSRAEHLGQQKDSATARRKKTKAIANKFGSFWKLRRELRRKMVQAAGRKRRFFASFNQAKKEVASLTQKVESFLTKQKKSDAQIKSEDKDLAKLRAEYKSASQDLKLIRRARNMYHLQNSQISRFARQKNVACYFIYNTIRRSRQIYGPRGRKHRYSNKFMSNTLDSKFKAKYKNVCLRWYKRVFGNSFLQTDSLPVDQYQEVNTMLDQFTNSTEVDVN